MAAVRVGQRLRSNCDHFAHVQVMEFEVAASAKGLASQDHTVPYRTQTEGWEFLKLYTIYSICSIITGEKLMREIL